MKRNILDPRAAAWLAETFERNRLTFAGWRMEHDDNGSNDGGSGGDGGNGGNGGDTAHGSPGDPGFPTGTPVDQMTTEQQAAYYRHQARKHEDRNKDILKLTGGKYGDDLKADLEELARLRQAQMTDGEKAIEDARRTAREEAQREFGPRMARLAFETALSHIDDDERAELLDTLNLTSVLTDEGGVDTAKVRRIVEKIAPADKDQGNQRHDFGAGRRGAGAVKTGVSAGAELYAARRKSTTNS